MLFCPVPHSHTTPAHLHAIPARVESSTIRCTCEESPVPEVPEPVFVGCDRCRSWLHARCQKHLIDPLIKGSVDNMNDEELRHNLESIEFVCPWCRKRKSKEDAQNADVAEKAALAANAEEALDEIYVICTQDNAVAAVNAKVDTLDLKLFTAIFELTGAPTKPTRKNLVTFALALPKERPFIFLPKAELLGRCGTQGRTSWTRQRCIDHLTGAVKATTTQGDSSMADVVIGCSFMPKLTGRAKSNASIGNEKEPVILRDLKEMKGDDTILRIEQVCNRDARPHHAQSLVARCESCVLCCFVSQSCCVSLTPSHNSRMDTHAHTHSPNRYTSSGLCRVHRRPPSKPLLTRLSLCQSPLVSLEHRLIGTSLASTHPRWLWLK